jgi:hypothetical protein
MQENRILQLIGALVILIAVAAVAWHRHVLSMGERPIGRARSKSRLTLRCVGCRWPPRPLRGKAASARQAVRTTGTERARLCS